MRLTAGQAEVMKFLNSPVASSRPYSSVTAFAPTAVSSTSAKPRERRAVRITSKSCVSNAETNEGARLATTFLPLASSARTLSVSLCTCLAFCGQTRVHLPQSMHLCSMIFA